MVLKCGHIIIPSFSVAVRRWFQRADAEIAPRVVLANDRLCMLVGGWSSGLVDVYIQYPLPMFGRDMPDRRRIDQGTLDIRG